MKILRHYVCIVFIFLNAPIFAQLGNLNYHGEFEPNAGQIIDLNGNKLNDVKYKVETKNYINLIYKNKLAYIINSNFSNSTHFKPGRNTSVSDTTVRFDFIFINSSEEAEVIQKKPNNGQINYLNNGIKKSIGVKTYREVQVINLYEGIDLVYHLYKGSLYQVFKIKPNVNPNQIGFIIRGAKKITLEGGNKLNVLNELGAVDFEYPKVFNEDSLYQYTINLKLENCTIRPLNIPTSPREQFIVFGPRTKEIPNNLEIFHSANQSNSTYFAGTGRDEITSMHISNDNYLFIGGQTSSFNFPVSPGVYMSSGYFCSDPAGNTQLDGFISKFNPNRERIFTTYFGGCGVDVVDDLIAQSGTTPIITAMSLTTDYPNTFPIQYKEGAYNSNTPSNAIISALSQDGSSLIWGAYIGENNSERIIDLAFDINYNIYCVGRTSGPGLPIQLNPTGFNDNSYNGGRTDGFILQFQAKTFALIWGTYFGGNNEENITAIDFDSFGNFAVSGFSYGNTTVGPHALDFNFAKGGRDAFVVKFNSLGQKVWGTHLGTWGDEGGGYYGQNMAMDSVGNVYLCGYTDKGHEMPNAYNGYLSTNTTIPAQPYDIYVYKYSFDGRLEWGNIIGGSRWDQASCITVDNLGNSFITGSSSSPDYVVTPRPGSFYSFHSPISGKEEDDKDIILTQFDSEGNLSYSTCMGGTKPEVGSKVSITQNGSGLAKSVIICGETQSNNYNPIYKASAQSYNQSTNMGGVDGCYSEFLLTSSSSPPSLRQIQTTAEKIIKIEYNSRDYLLVDWINGNYKDSQITVCLFDLNGRSVYLNNHQTNIPFSIPTHNLKPGVFNIIVYNSTRLIQSEKVIIW